MTFHPVTLGKVPADVEAALLTLEPFVACNLPVQGAEHELQLGLQFVSIDLFHRFQ